jgi:hypothetical protein
MPRASGERGRKDADMGSQQPARVRRRMPEIASSYKAEISLESARCIAFSYEIFR